MAAAEVATAQAHVQELEAALRLTEIRAPTDGCILRLLLREGETVWNTVSLPVVEFANTSQLRVRAEVDEQDLHLVQPGAAVKITTHEPTPLRVDGVVAYCAEVMGHKRLTTDNPRELRDQRIREILVQPASTVGLLIQERVDVLIDLGSP